MTRFLACLPLTLALILVCWPAVSAEMGFQVKSIKPPSSAQRSHPHPGEEGNSEQTDEQNDDEAKESKSDSDPQATDDKSKATREESVADAKEKTDKDADKEKDTKSKKPKSHKVERQSLEIDAKLKGVFVAVDSHEVVLRPEVWSEFKVVEAVEHGAVVKKGDVLVRFDDEKIEKDLADEAIDQRLSELALMQIEEQFPREQRLREIAYEQAKLSHEQLLEDYDYYRETDRPFRVQTANFRYESAKEDLASQEEELAQLEKMYAADDLTEETEAIVLRRQRFRVATAKLSLELQKANHEYTLNVTLPRFDDDYAKRVEQSKLKLDQARTAKEKGTTRAKFELEKKRNARAKSIERHAKLVSDRALMVIKAPADGVVYYGRAVNGKWSEVTSMTNKLKPFGKVTANTVFMTIVSQRPLQVVAKVSEKELPDFKVGLATELIPSADDELSLEGKVAAVTAVPDADGKFAVDIDVELSDAPSWLVAGMTCEANVTVYNKQSAIVIPSSYVATDDEDDKQKYVMLLSDKDEPTRKDVKLGRKKDKRVEVLSGLSEGDRIVKEEKKDKSKED